MELVEPEKPIHFHIFTPHDSMWKSSKNQKAEVQLIFCRNSEKCDLLKRGECTYKAVFGWQACPYGNYRKFEGFTPKARAYHSWISDQKVKYDGVPYIKEHTEVLASVGDYIFLPYAHMDMADVGWIQRNTGIFGKGCAFLRNELFTPATILALIYFKPLAFNGGEIGDYQEKSVPKFVKHLQEKFPELLKEAENLDIKRSLTSTNSNGFFRCKIRTILENYSYKGRKAVLQSLTPNIGKFIDIHKSEWIWDGEYLISVNSRASFMLVDKFDEIRIKPKPRAVVTISEENQVNEKTEFLS